jgi:protein TonB
MAAQLSAIAPSFTAPSAQQMRSIVRLSAIIVAHIGLFYVLQSGMTKHAGRPNQAEPKEIFASLITADRPAEPVSQKQQTPQVQPTPKRVVPPTPVKPIPKQKAPAEHAITTPPAVPQPVVQPQTAATPPAASTAPPSASTAPATPAPIRTITSGVEYMQAPQPEYPSISKRIGEEGRVVLRVLVNEKGRTESVEVQTSSGSSRLDEAAKQALKRAQFKPHTEDGKAVAMHAIVPITFQLNK